ncbi:MAG TPA: nuclear transport factor 2 family protein [Vicinamibacteria bacterium]|jgi:hypothetical protein
MRVLVLVAVLVSGSALPAGADEATDKEAVKAVVKAAYVDGVHAVGDPEAMRRGFHSGFNMLVLKDGQMSAVPIADWIARLEKAGSASQGKPRPAIKAEFTLVDVTGDAAVTRVEIFRAGRHVFTDYLSLYRFPDGWKIVGKTFFAHPQG